MEKILFLKAVRWEPIIQMSDGINNKFNRIDGQPLLKGDNIYFFQKEFYDMLKNASVGKVHEYSPYQTYATIIDALTFAKAFEGPKYFYNQSSDGDVLYKVVQIIDAFYSVNGDVRPVIVAQDITDTPEEFYIREESERTKGEVFKVVDLEYWR